MVVIIALQIAALLCFLAAVIEPPAPVTWQRLVAMGLFLWLLTALLIQGGVGR